MWIHAKITQRVNNFNMTVIYFISVILKTNSELSLSAEVNGKTSGALTSQHFQSRFRLLPHVCGADLQVAIRLLPYPLISYPKIGHLSCRMTWPCLGRLAQCVLSAILSPFQLADNNESTLLERVQHRGDL